MGVAVFVFADFIARYPQFASVSPTSLAAIFNQDAGLYLTNTPRSPVCNVARRTILLYMLTAHIATLDGVLSADAQFLPVGRVSEAHEGTVGASLEYPQPDNGTAAWFLQTQPGAAFWQATSSLRGMRYIPQPTIVENLNTYGARIIPGYGVKNRG